MLPTSSLAVLAAFACTVFAQQPPPAIVGYGTQACTKFDANNAPQADQTACPFGSCVIEPETGFYFCGIKGAPCASLNDCNYGRCLGGVCAGGFNDLADGDVNNCLGTLFDGADGRCGTADALCAIGGDYACTSVFCGSNNHCRAPIQAGDTCLTDDTRPCGPGLYAWRDHATGACVCRVTPPPTASQRARARRNTVSLCPALHTACPLGTGFECIDTHSNLERCGGCNEDTGGVDCTALPGIEAVGCVEGQCEIWACAAGYSFDAGSAECREH